jgi:hypothetical protein
VRPVICRDQRHLARRHGGEDLGAMLHVLRPAPHAKITARAKTCIQELANDIRQRTGIDQGGSMDLRLHLLDSFRAKGSDGSDYKVRAFERLVPLPANSEQWEPTGEAEYRLDDGRVVEVEKDGSMRIARTVVRLTPLPNR